MQDRDPAAARFFVIQAVRISGLAIMFYGILAAKARVPWPEGAPVEWAWALALIGASDAFLIPILLSRLWSSDRK